jgi:hypothetical protein
MHSRVNERGSEHFSDWAMADAWYIPSFFFCRSNQMIICINPLWMGSTDVIFFEVEVMTSVSLFRGFFSDTCQRIFDRSEACWSFMSVNSFIIDVQYSSLPGLKQGMAADGAHYAVELD